MPDRHLTLNLSHDIFEFCLIGKVSKKFIKRIRGTIHKIDKTIFEKKSHLILQQKQSKVKAPPHSYTINAMSQYFPEINYGKIRIRKKS